MNAAVELKPGGCDTRKRCSDFDEDCAHVANHQRCFEGRIQWWANGSMSYLPMADGFCPYLHGEVER